MTQIRNPTLAQAIDAHVRRALDELHTCLPGVVTDYDPATQRANVKPLVRHAYQDESDARQTESLSVVTGVPVQFMAAGGFMLTCPISTGRNGLGPATTGLLIFAEASLDRWLSGSGAEVDPKIDHRHDLSDGVFVPGLRPFGAPLAGVPSDHAVFGVPNGLAIHLRTDAIKLGSDAATEALVLGSTYRTQEDLVLTALNTLCAALAVEPLLGPSSKASAGALATAITTFQAAAASYLSTEVKSL
ncbi:MAG TPA: Gp138 family membrane-puncturing spike protein [Cellulomonadaceae bacterium]|nr:Gp138 family membrane-puncturing spike protein [Cellulomonadaceae bacterium]